MLQRAISYKSEIENFINDLANEEYLKYWIYSSRHHAGVLTIDGDEWNNMHRVSKSRIYPDLLYGYLHADIHRDPNRVAVSIVNLQKKANPILVKDTLLFIDNLFGYGFNKIVFKVVIGNPAEDQYDIMIERLCGTIVGIFKEDVKLLDGKYYDVKYYEILRDGYYEKKRV